MERIDSKLWLPPKGTAQPKSSPWSDEAMRASMAALNGAAGGAVL